MLALSAFAQAPGSYMKVSGLPGTSQSQGREDWNSVISFHLSLQPPSAEKDNAKVLVNRCALSVDANLGKAGGAAVGLIGQTITEPVLIEVDKGVEGAVLTLYRARLLGAKIAAYEGTGGGALSEALLFHFTQAEVTTWEQTADGKPGGSTTGTFNCGPTP
jgi:hypothetical protein